MITPDQIEALQALHQGGTYLAAAKQLGKSYGSINYLIHSLEQNLGLSLLDRNEYRTRLNSNGKAVLRAGKKLLSAESDLLKLCKNMKNEWESEITLVYDGILPVHPIIQAIMNAKKIGSTTKVISIVAFHEDVENEFMRLNAELMFSISPPKTESLPSIRLETFNTTLVTSATNPLAKSKWTMNSLKEHSLVTVRGSSSRLGLSTLELEQNTSFTVGDFHAKKEVLLAGGGYGWMPDFMILKELRNGSLVRVQTDFANKHRFSPRLYHRHLDSLGKTSRLLLENLNAFK